MRSPAGVRRRRCRRGETHGGAYRRRLGGRWDFETARRLVCVARMSRQLCANRGKASPDAGNGASRALSQRRGEPVRGKRTRRAFGHVGATSSRTGQWRLRRPVYPVDGPPRNPGLELENEKEKDGGLVRVPQAVTTGLSFMLCSCASLQHPGHQDAEDRRIPGDQRQKEHDMSKRGGSRSGGGRSGGGRGSGGGRQGGSPTNASSKTGNPSGGGRGNNPPRSR